MNFEVHEEKSAVLILISAISYVGFFGTILTEMYSTGRDIQIIMNMLITFFMLEIIQWFYIPMTIAPFYVSYNKCM